MRLRRALLLPLALVATLLPATAQADDPTPAARAVLAGTVVDRSGAPVAGAVVSTYPAWGYARTDDHGRWRTEVEPGRQNVCATAPREADLAQDCLAEGPVEVAAGEVRDGLVLELAPASHLRGRVVDERGAPVSGLYVRSARLTSDDRVGPVTGWDRTGPDGRYDVQLDRGGRVQVCVGDGFERRYLRRCNLDGAPVEVPVGTSVDDLDQVALDRNDVVGRVTTEDGRPVPTGTRVAVATTGEVVPVGRDGRWSVRGLDPGAHRMAVVAAPGRYRSRPFWVRVVDEVTDVATAAVLEVAPPLRPSTRPRIEGRLEVFNVVHLVQPEWEGGVAEVRIRWTVGGRTVRPAPQGDDLLYLRRWMVGKRVVAHLSATSSRERSAASVTSTARGPVRPPWFR